MRTPVPSLQIRFGFCVLAASLTTMSQRLPAATSSTLHDFSLSQVMSAPFPSSLTAAPAGGRVAWVYDNKGSRNIWTAEADGRGRYIGHALTHYSGDDGYDLGELTWDWAGQRLVYTRGGSFEDGGAVNTTNLVVGPPPQAIWTVSADGAEPRQLGLGNSPAISPRGDRVAFLSGGQVWSVPLDGSKPASQLINDRGAARALTWSPDGSRLAFVSVRSDHSFIGVFDVRAQSLVWMSPSLDRDQSPEWSPDGRELGFVRVPSGGKFFFLGLRTGEPWSIWIGDPASGKAHAVWRATPGPGSVFHSTLSSRVLLWTDTDRLIFPWEQTGWVHLYSLAITSGHTQELTPGAFEVFNVSSSLDRQRVVYSSNQDDTDRLHLWQIASANAAPVRLTGGSGIEDYPVLCSDGRVVALSSDARKPLRPTTLDAKAKLVDVAPDAVPADFPANQLVEPQPVTFNATDGQLVHGQLFLPRTAHATHRPAVLFFHGGPVREMLLGWHPMDAYNYMYALNQYLVNEGYVVLSVNYRGGIGYGLNYREPLNFGPGGASELNDILGAALYLRARPEVDPTRVGIYGASYGGLMTALGLARASGLLTAGVDYAGVHDWRTMIPQLSAPGAATGAAQLAFDSSAVATLDKWRSPVLVVHADDDRNVPFSQSVELVEGLRKHDVEVEQLVIPNEIHDLLRRESWLTLFNATDEFFQRRLHLSPQDR